MHHTTVGIGPFKPAIVFNGRLYVQDESYDNEDEAGEAARRVVDQMLAKATEVLVAKSFMPTREHR